MLPPSSTAVRLFRRLTVVVATCIFLWLALAWQLFVNVDGPEPGRTDAVIMLAGAGGERLPVARRIQAELNAPVLVLSNTDTVGNAAADALCHSAAFPSASLICFQPDEYDTRGEARVIADLVAENRWESVTIVTSQYHVRRAELLVRQCTDAAVQMVASHPELNAGEWLQRFVIESGGLLDAAVRPECSDGT